MAALPQREIPRADAIDVGSRDARSRLAAMVTKLLDHWNLTAVEQSTLLGLSTTSRSTLARYREGEPLADSRDLLDRAGHLLGIHKSLRILFPYDRDLAYGWMTQFNRRLGARPVDLISERGFRRPACGAPLSRFPAWLVSCFRPTLSFMAIWFETSRVFVARKTCSTI